MPSSSANPLKKYQLIFLLVFLVSALGLKLWQWHWPTADIQFKGQHLKVLVADTLARQYRGLGARNELGADGMLFPFGETSRLGFVMREMRFSIDIVWFADGEVVDFAPSVALEPGVSDKELKIYYPRQNANLVLELPAGWAVAHGLAIGDRLGETSR